MVGRNDKQVFRERNHVIITKQGRAYGSALQHIKKQNIQTMGCQRSQPFGISFVFGILVQLRERLISDCLLYSQKSMKVIIISMIEGTGDSD